jgi:hypothetical protein
MTLSRKETAWKKSRKFGDVKGGRTHPKVCDGVVRKYHSLKRPAVFEQLPIVIKDNPSKDFYFPVDEVEIITQLQNLPSLLTDGITHIWLRRIKKTDYERGDAFQAMFICGSGVNLITINAFPRNLKMYFGIKKPNRGQLRFYSKWADELVSCDDSGHWFLKWSEDAIKDYYLRYLLLHEVGHFVDRYSKRFRRKSSDKRAEDFADSFAVIWNLRNGIE